MIKGKTFLRVITQCDQHKTCDHRSAELKTWWPCDHGLQLNTAYILTCINQFTTERRYKGENCTNLWICFIVFSINILSLSSPLSLLLNWPYECNPLNISTSTTWCGQTLTLLTHLKPNELNNKLTKRKSLLSNSWYLPFRISGSEVRYLPYNSI